jgi:beta-glucanase (GH16 family)
LIRIPLRTLIILQWPMLCVSASAQSGADGQWIAFRRAGAPNSNLQCFTPKNVVVSGGNLMIMTRAEAATCSSFDLPPKRYRYTSGFVAMRSFNFLYGSVEFRARFGGGAGTGTWPVVWMADHSCQASDSTGTDDSCNGQEIDIAEILNSDVRHVNQRIHVDNFKHNDGCIVSADDTSQHFHVYDLTWSPSKLLFRIDGDTTCTITEHVPDAPMYIKITVNLGGIAGHVDNGSLPWSTSVDYLRVWQDSKVVFADDFDREDSVEPAPLVSRDLSLANLSRRRSLPWRKWTFGILLTAAVAIAMNRVLRRNQRKKWTAE